MGKQNKLGSKGVWGSIFSDNFKNGKCHKLHTYILIDRRLGGGASNRKSFRFVRACARFPLPSENEPQSDAPPFPFSLCVGDAFPFPLRFPPKCYPALVGLMGKYSVEVVGRLMQGWVAEWVGVGGSFS